jgi:sodium pump decarboxylase gamma subunit
MDFDQATINTGLILALVGMVVVFASLSVLAGIIVLVKRLIDRPAPAPAEQVAAPRTPAEPQPQRLDPQIVAAISAAVASLYLGRSVRVRRVRFADSGSPTWSTEGRARIMGSHRPHLRRR